MPVNTGKCRPMKDDGLIKRPRVLSDGGVPVATAKLGMVRNPTVLMTVNFNQDVLSGIGQMKQWSPVPA